MNHEQEIKDIIRGGGKAPEKAEAICKITSFDYEKTLKGLLLGGETPAIVYEKILQENKNE